MAPYISLTGEAPFHIDRALLRAMRATGPRYTSYPTADRFSDTFTDRDYQAAVTDRRTRGAARPISMYLHIPFCESLCYFCACNKIVSTRRDKAGKYLAYLKREITMQAALFSSGTEIRQLHLGGGTPTYLDHQQFEDLLAHLRDRFTFASDTAGEFAIEVDPRTVTPERIVQLRQQGFNRISLGVQDYDEDVQRAINRVQPDSQTTAIVDAARASGFRSVNMDLIYGLPRQTLFTMERTIEQVLRAAPDRIALYHYAHLPRMFKAQRLIPDDSLPTADTKLDMLGLAITLLGAAGYRYIGMDHFALAGDELAIAQQQGRLRRNFQGYSAHGDLDIVACGVSAIGAVGPTYSQNVKTLDAYYQRIDANALPIERGVVLTMDDAIRRTVIQALMCQSELSIKAIEMAFPVGFAVYFAAEIERLRVFQAAQLIDLGPLWLTVTPRGRVLIRNICMVFDRYLDAEAAAPRFSSTV